MKFSSHYEFVNLFKMHLGNYPMPDLYLIPLFMQNGLNMDASYDFQDCTGLKVKPRKGDGLLFYSLFPNATIDPVSNIIIIITLQPICLKSPF
jgi:hypothetical protein